MEQTIQHHICYIPEIIIAVSTEWRKKLRETANPENKEKRKALYSTIRRWIYLSWLLKEETKSVHGSDGRISIINEIKLLKDEKIPALLSPHKIVYITPELILRTGRLIQFDINKNPIELDFTKEVKSTLSKMYW